VDSGNGQGNGIVSKMVLDDCHERKRRASSCPAKGNGLETRKVMAGFLSLKVENTVYRAEI